MEDQRSEAMREAVRAKCNAAAVLDIIKERRRRVNRDLREAQKQYNELISEICRIACEESESVEPPAGSR